MRILGVDPGLRLTGYGCVETRGAETPTLVEAGVFRLGKRGVDGVKQSLADAKTVSSRLIELDRDLCDALERLKPQVVAVESLFAHYGHPATAIVMGHARGVILLAIARAGVRLMEFKPNEVKKSLTGHGLADKARMQRAIQTVFGLDEPPRPPDVADALALALCAAGRLGSVVERGQVSKHGVRKSRRVTSAEMARLSRK
jgi:crossover junction endodeoxyribonuclease RuvC